MEQGGRAHRSYSSSPSGSGKGSPPYCHFVSCSLVSDFDVSPPRRPVSFSEESWSPSSRPIWYKAPLRISCSRGFGSRPLTSTSGRVVHGAFLVIVSYFIDIDRGCF